MISRCVPRRANFVTWLRPIGFFVIAIATVVTPIGLYETIESSSNAEMTTFSYVSDIGPMGLGTSPRNDIGFFV